MHQHQTILSKRHRTSKTNAEPGVATAGPGTVKVKSIRLGAERRHKTKKQEIKRRLKPWLRELGN